MMTLAEAAKGADPIRKEKKEKKHSGNSSAVGYSGKASKQKRPY